MLQDGGQQQQRRQQTLLGSSSGSGGTPSESERLFVEKVEEAKRQADEESVSRVALGFVCRA